METNLGLWIVKFFKRVLCSRTHRAGRFNVREASRSNLNLDKLNGVIIQTDTDMLIAKQQSSDLSGCCRSPLERRSSPTGSIASTQSQSQLTPSRQLSDGERLKKVILELIDTERTYVKHLNNLLENYLEPLRNAPFLSSAEVSALFGNIREIVAFQRLFLQALTEAIEMEPGFAKFDHPYEFKHILFSIGSAVLYYATQFKLYSSFCASHSKAQKVLHPSEGNQALQEFLMSRNPRQQHSATLESYLIKPIQRILKYPLLLQQLKTLTEPGSDEHRHLLEALKVMEKVAEHINEMQRIHEEYGAIFDHLFRQHQKSCKQAIDLSPGDLLYYGGVEWLNISDFLGKIKKGLELHAMCFVFKTAVVFLCKERLRQKKKLMGGSGKNSSSEVEIIRYQVLIPVTEVQVRASSMKDMDNHFLWELIHLKSQVQRRSEKVYHLSNSTSEFRNAFLKTIRQIIRESVRNMNIPLNKPPSSGSSGTGGSSGGGTGGGGSSGGRMNTNTLQPSRSGGGKKKHPQTPQTGSLQRHSGAKYDYDSVESYDNVPETQPHLYHQSKGQQQQEQHEQHEPQNKHDEHQISPQHQQKQPQQYSNNHQNQQHKQLISQLQNHQKKAQPKQDQTYSPEQPKHQHNQQQTQPLNNHQQPHQNKTQQHPLQQQSSSGSYDSDQQQGSLRTRSKTMSDAMDELSDSTTKSDGGRDDYGTRSEGEEESSERKPISLGRTPNHLSLSTTSTLSTGSTGSQARLIQASNQPSNYQPVKSLGSPIWKPRENFGSTQSGKSALGSSQTSLSRAGKPRHERGSAASGVNNNAPRSAGNDERIQLPKTNPAPFSYIGSSFRMPFSTSSLQKAHSTLDLKQTDDDYTFKYNDNNCSFIGKQKSLLENYSYNRNTRNTIYEENSQFNCSENKYEKTEYSHNRIPNLCTVTTYNKKDTKHSIQILASKNVTNKSNFNGNGFVYNKSKSLEPNITLQRHHSNEFSSNRESYSSPDQSSLSNSLSSSTNSIAPDTSTFVKQGASFQLIDNSLLKSSIDLSSPILRQKECFTRRKQNIEETFDRLSAALTDQESLCSRQRSTRNMDKNVYLDHIINKLEEMKANNTAYENKRTSNITIETANEPVPPPKPPTRSSSYIEKGNIPQYNTKRYTEFEQYNPLSDCFKDEKYSASIAVLNDTAQTIDSLVSQLQKF